jgi:hypothetical protein
MVAVGLTFLGKVALGDWDGYQAMYDRGGGYLVDQGRDPLFSWIMDRAFDVFGGGAYEIFRIVLFISFTFLAAVVAFSGVLEGSLIFASVLVSVDAFVLKSLVQIREGIAFAVVMWSTALFPEKRNIGVIISVLGCISSAFIHAGTCVFLLVWVVALCLRLLSIGRSNPHLISKYLTSSAVISGIAVAVLINQDAQFLERTLRHLGVTGDGPVTVSAWKYLYWAAMGIVVVVVRAQVADANREFKYFRSVYAVVLGAGLVPLLYVMCVITVVTEFTATVAAMEIRMLLTALELSLVTIVMRGRANALTGLVAVATLTDQMRLILVP